MVAEGEDELICDMAQTYHIWNWRELPLRTAAILACGLPEDSRVMRKLRGEKISLGTKLQAAMLDSLTTLVWFQTEDGKKHRNRPPSMLRKLIGAEPETKLEGFETAEEFEAERKRITGGM